MTTVGVKWLNMFTHRIVYRNVASL